MLLRFHSLRARIITWSFVPTTIILMVVAISTFYAYQKVTEDLTIGRNRELTRLSASTLANDLARYPQLLTPAARNYGFQTDSAPVLQTTLRDMAGRLVMFDGGVVILDLNGRVIAAQPESLGLIGQDWSNRGYFRQIIRSTEPVFSDVVKDGPNETKVVAVAVPILSTSGDFKGVMVGMFRLGAASTSTFYGGIVKLRIGEEGTTYIVDSTGQTIYDSGSTVIGQDISDREPVKQVLAKRVGYLRTSAPDGGDGIASYAPIPGSNWGLVTEEDWAALMAPSQGYRQALLVLLALGVVLPTVVVTFGVRRITDPIEKLMHAAQGVAGGNFGQTVKVETGDELEELGKQFNRMSAQLKESYSELENRVADRTKELATVNAIGTVVSQSLDLEEVLHLAMDKMIELFHMDTGAAYRLDESKNNLMLVAHQGVSEGFVENASHLEISAGAVGKAINMVQPYVQKTTDYVEPDKREILETEGLAMVVSIPITAKGRVLGAVNLGSRQWRQLSDDEMSLLEAIGRQIGVAVENARLYEQAEEVAAATERSRLARDLHDAVTQTLFSASLIADVLPKIYEKNPEEAARRVEELRRLNRGALAEMRTLLLELRPSALLEANMDDLLRQLAEAATGRSRIPVSLSLCCSASLPPDAKVVFYRIAQESLSNIIKHSGADHATVALTCGEHGTEMIISDNGKGFERSSVPSDHFGLRIMTERAQSIGAILSVDSRPGEGTDIIVRWQIAEELEEA